MTSPVNFYADPSSFAALKKDAANQDPKALREAARQFESIFTQMMLKSMRDANKTFAATDSPLSSEQGDFYREMFDSQIAMQLSKGKGLGLADILVRQLQGKGAASKTDAATRSDSQTTGVSTLQTKSKIFPLATKDAVALPLSVPSPRPNANPTNSTQVQSQNKEDIAAQFAALIERSSAATSVVEPSAPDAKTVTQPERSVTPNPSTDPSPPKSRTDNVPQQPFAKSPADFISQLWPHATAVGKELGVDPRTLIAHAALETGWGKNIPCNPDGTCSFNLFGIKASGRWHGSAVGVNTVEYENGVAVQKRASFRAYDSVADSFRDYASLIKSSPRYAAALQSGSDASAFANALQQGGYATDPNYASKLASVADRLHIAFKSDASRPLAFGRSVPSASGGEQT